MDTGTDPPRRPKVMRVSTRCRTVDELVAAFATLVDEHSLVVLTDQQRAIGSRQPFVVELADGTFVMKGEAEVVESTAPPRGRLRLRFLALDAVGREVHQRMLERKRANGTGPLPSQRAQTEPGSMKPLVRIPDLPGRRVEAAAPAPQERLPAAAPPAPFARPVPATALPRAPAQMPIPVVPMRDGAVGTVPPVRKAPLPRLPAATPAVPTPIVAPPLPTAPAASPTATPPPVSADTPAVIALPRFDELPELDEGPDTRVDHAVMSTAIATRSSSIADALATAVEGERTPGSPYVLPANPFGEVAPESLEAFVECTLYEETGQFYVGGLLDELAVGGPPSLDPPIEPPAAEPAPPTLLAAPAAVPAPAPVPAVLASPPLALASPPLALASPPLVPASPPLPVAMTPTPPDDVVLPPRRLPWKWIVAAALIALGLVVVIGLGSGDGDRDRPAPAAAPGKAPATAPRAAAAATDADAGTATATAAATVTAAATATATATDAGTATVAPPDAAPAAVEALTGGDCRLRVVTDPVGSAVSFDGKSLGDAPIDAAIPCGKGRLAITRTRYEPFDRVIDPAEPQTIRLTRPEVKVTFTSTPPGARFAVDGHSLGKAPLSTTLKAFTTIKISAELPGYQKWTQTLYVKKTTSRVVAPLKKAPRSRTR